MGRAARTDLRDVVRVVSRCRDLEREGLSSGARHALLVLASYYPNIRPPQDRLAANLGASRRSVNYWLKELEEAGFVTRRRGYKQRATVYLLSAGLTGSGSTPSDDAEPDPEYF